MTRLHHGFPGPEYGERSLATHVIGQLLAIGTTILALAGAFTVGMALASVPPFSLVAALAAGFSILVTIPVGIELLSRWLADRLAARRTNDEDADADADESVRLDPTPTIPPSTRHRNRS